MKLVSIVVPVYNEEDNINHFYQAICQTMKGLNYNWELVFVDDGSSDSSWEILEKMEEDDSRVQPIKLSRNMGHQLALTCGMDYADGDMVITMDGDMQHPPELIPVLIGAWEQGYEVVQTVRRTTEGVSWIKNFSSNCFYWLINHISDTHVIEGGSDFRLLDDDGVVYAYGKSTNDGSTESAFAPLDRYMPEYGCTEIQYRNKSTGQYVTI